MTIIFSSPVSCTQNFLMNYYSLYCVSYLVFYFFKKMSTKSHWLNMLQFFIQIMRDTSKLMPFIYFNGNYNRYREYNNIIGQSKFSALKKHFFFIPTPLAMHFFISDEQEPECHTWECGLSHALWQKLLKHIINHLTVFKSPV